VDKQQQHSTGSSHGVVVRAVQRQLALPLLKLHVQTVGPSTQPFLLLEQLARLMFSYDPAPLQSVAKSCL
jgi:hypothetical protein